VYVTFHGNFILMIELLLSFSNLQNIYPAEVCSLLGQKKKCRVSTNDLKKKWVDRSIIYFILFFIFFCDYS